MKPEINSFRTNWPLDRWGKWKERDYPSSTYPAFACGSGSVLSTDLTGWLADNADRLKHFQGEDVSLGIWLAALNPVLINDEDFQCFGVKGPYAACSSRMVVSPDHTPEGLRGLWKKKTEGRDFCKT